MILTSLLAGSFSSSDPRFRFRAGGIQSASSTQPLPLSYLQQRSRLADGRESFPGWQNGRRTTNGSVPGTTREFGHSQRFRGHSMRTPADHSTSERKEN